MELNGGHGILVTSEGRPHSVCQPEVADGLVRRVLGVGDPEKTAHLTAD